MRGVAACLHGAGGRLATLRLARHPINRAVSMTIRFGTASSAIPLDFIDMYCFEYPINLRYSRGVLNNISIKEYSTVAALRLRAGVQAVLPTGREPRIRRQKPERSKNQARTSAGARARNNPLHQSTLTSLLKKRSEIDINFGAVGEWVLDAHFPNPSKTI